MDKKNTPSCQIRSHGPLISAARKTGITAFTSLMLVLAGGSQSVLAGPEGGVVVRGEGTIEQADVNTTVINQQSHRLGLQWETFNVAQQERVTFNQPSSSAVALNNILDQNPSLILGAIDANGRVFLINPNGLIFGETAQVNVGSLVASSLGISMDDFMSGNYDLTAVEGEGTGAVINRGLINAATGGSVTLVGGAVANEGLIIADLGSVNLAAGRRATLDFDGDGLILFEIDGEVLENLTGLDAAVSNSGEIAADGGQVLLSARAAQSVFDSAVNNEGLIRAGRIENEGGVVRLVGTGGTVLHSGTIDASGVDAQSEGGTVHLLGDRVGLIDNASIDASGDAGGGTVLIGGDYQGGNPDIENASRTYVGENATILADAKVGGDGGNVIVWSEEVTSFSGSASVRGGATGGDGGFVEISGKQSLQFDGAVNASAPSGNDGTVLFDPTDIEIVAGGADGASAGDVLFGDAPGVEPWEVDPADLDAVAGNIVLQANNDITVTDAVNLSTEARR